MTVFDQFKADHPTLAPLARSARQRVQLVDMFSPQGVLVGPGQVPGTGVAQCWMGRDYTALRDLVMRVMRAGYKVVQFCHQDRSYYRATGEFLDARSTLIAQFVPDPRVFDLACLSTLERELDSSVVAVATGIQPPPSSYSARRPPSTWWFDAEVLDAASDVLATTRTA